MTYSFRLVANATRTRSTFPDRRGFNATLVLICRNAQPTFGSVSGWCPSRTSQSLVTEPRVTIASGKGVAFASSSVRIKFVWLAVTEAC